MKLATLREAGDLVQEGRLVWINLVPSSKGADAYDPYRADLESVFGITKADLDEVVYRTGRTRSHRPDYLFAAMLNPHLKRPDGKPLDIDFRDIQITDDPSQYIIEVEPLYIFAGDAWVLTIQVAPRDIFREVRLGAHQSGSALHGYDGSSFAAHLMEQILDYLYHYLAVVEAQRAQYDNGQHSDHEHYNRILSIIRTDLSHLLRLTDGLAAACDTIVTRPSLPLPMAGIVRYLARQAEPLKTRIKAEMEVATDALASYHSHIQVRTNIRIHRLTLVTTILLPISIALTWLVSIPHVATYFVRFGLSEQSLALGGVGLLVLITAGAWAYPRLLNRQLFTLPQRKGE